MVESISTVTFIAPPSLFVADVSGENNAKNNASASDYDEVSGKPSNVYDTANCSDNPHVYAGLGEMKD